MDSDSGTYDQEKKADVATVHREDALADIPDPDAALSEQERRLIVSILNL